MAGLPSSLSTLEEEEKEEAKDNKKMWKEGKKENKLLCCRTECLNHVRGGFDETTNEDNVGAGIHENEVEDTACIEL